MTRETQNPAPPVTSTEERGWISDADVLATHQDIEGASWHLGIMDTLDQPGFLSALHTLCNYSEHPNVFFDDAFLKNSARSVARHKIKYLFLAEQYSGACNLKLFAPVTMERVGKTGPRFFRVWSTEFSPLGQPLIDRKDIRRTVEEFHLCLGDIGSASLARGILFPTIPAKKAFAGLISQLSEGKSSLHKFNSYERACLRPVGKNGYRNEALSGKHRQRLNAAWRKLNEKGEVKITCTTDIPEVEVELLDFMYLESRGWKGKKNSALINSEKTRQLALGSVHDLAAKGKCEIFSMTLDDVVISSAIFLNCNGYYTAWKIAFHEAYAKYSVGNLLVVHATEDISSRTDFRFLDSVALGDNETANRLWPDRLPITNIAIAFGKNNARVAKQIALNLSAYIKLKRGLKKLLSR